MELGHRKKAAWSRDTLETLLRIPIEKLFQKQEKTLSTNKAAQDRRSKGGLDTALDSPLLLWHVLFWPRSHSCGIPRMNDASGTWGQPATLRRKAECYRTRGACAGTPAHEERQNRKLATTTAPRTRVRTHRLKECEATSPTVYARTAIRRQVHKHSRKPMHRTTRGFG